MLIPARLYNAPRVPPPEVQDKYRGCLFMIRPKSLSQRLTLGGLVMQVLKHAGLSKGLPLCSA
jgi:hypothetical protein